MTDRELLAFLDVTSLTGAESEAEVLALAERLQSSPVVPAALCIYPTHLAAVAAAQPSRTWALATVVNFPTGSLDPDVVGRDVERAFAEGAQEIDAVLALDAFFAGDLGRAAAVFHAVRAAAPDACFKAILETGDVRHRPGSWGRAADCALEAGADFLKTSTGKVPVGATSEAVEVLLDAIGASAVGLKVSGGIRTSEAAAAFAAQVAVRFPNSPLLPTRFRIGASELFNLLTHRARL
jgi:deoxyribose-phosphate aldolase